MANRNLTFSVNEYYHCYNRGVDKRTVFCDKQDYAYFMQSIEAYNSVETFGKLRLSLQETNQKIVEVLAVCLLPNHYHMVLKELQEDGISKFMQRVGGGYTMYFNEKNKRSGSLFQGAFKSKHIETDQDLRQVVSYVVHNYRIHNITNQQQYRSFLNNTSDFVQGLNIEKVSNKAMIEIAEIIKSQRLTFDES